MENYFHLQMMSMTDGNRQGVGGISAGQGGKPQQHPDHVLHLSLFRLTIAHYGSFDFLGAVVMNPQTILHGRNHCRSPGLAKLQGRTGIGGHEHILHCGHHRIVELDHLIDAIKDLIQTMGKGKLRGRLHHSTGHKMNPAGNNLDDTVAGNP